MLRVSVTRKGSSVIRSLVVIGASTNGRIETINDVGTLHRALLKMVWLACFSRIPANDIQRLVAFVARIALSKTARTTRPAAACYSIIGWRGSVAGSSRAVGSGSGLAIFRELRGWA